MANILLIGMIANFFRLTTRLLAWLSFRIFALSGSMARFTAKVRSTSQFLAACSATADILEPTLLILEHLLPAEALLFEQVWTFWARFVVLVTIVRHLRVPTWFRSIAGESTRRHLGTTWKRRLEHSSSAVATDLFKYRLSAGAAGSLVA